MIARENWGPGTMMNGKPVGCCDCVVPGGFYVCRSSRRTTVGGESKGIDDIRAIYSQQGIQAGAV